MVEGKSTLSNKEFVSIVLEIKKRMLMNPELVQELNLVLINVCKNYNRGRG